MTNLGEIRRVLGHRDFRLLWLARSWSAIGEHIVLVALALFVIAHTGSTTDLGLVLGAQSLPLVAFLLLGGVWADRLPRHRVTIATDLVRFLLHGLLAYLILSGRVKLWEVVVIEALFGSAGACLRPAASALLPQIVVETDIQPAMALTSLSNNVAQFAGPALATALVLGAGAGWAFALDAATFVLSATLLAQLRPRARTDPAATPPSPSPDGTRERPSVWREIREAAREVRSHSWVWATLAAFCAALFLGLAPWYVLGPTVARHQYGHLSLFGVIEATFGLGTIAGSFMGVIWRPRHPMRVAMLAVLLWPLAGILYAGGLTLLLVLPATVIAGGGLALFDVWWLTPLAERIPSGRLARVGSNGWMVSGGLLPIGYVLAGPLAGALGAVNVLIGGSALAFVALALGLIPRETRMLE